MNLRPEQLINLVDFTPALTQDKGLQLILCCPGTRRELDCMKTNIVEIPNREILINREVPIKDIDFFDVFMRAKIQKSNIVITRPSPELPCPLPRAPFASLSSPRC